MTSALGSTAMKYTATKNPPAFHEAMLGSAIQLSVLGYLWVQHTSAAACLTSPLACLSDLGAADPWGRQVALTVCLCTFFWIYSVLNRTAAGGSDPSIVDRLWSILPEAYTLHWFVARPSRRSVDAPPSSSAAVRLRGVPSKPAACMCFSARTAFS